MISTSTTHKTVGFSKNRLLQVLLVWYAAVWAVTSIAPLDRHDWFLENLLVFAVTAVLIGTCRTFSLSDLSCFLFSAFLTLDAVGGHYTHSAGPVWCWILRQR